MVHHFAKTMSVLDDTALNSAEFGRSGAAGWCFHESVVVFRYRFEACNLDNSKRLLTFHRPFFFWVNCWIITWKVLLWYIQLCERGVVWTLGIFCSSFQLVRWNRLPFFLRSKVWDQIHSPPGGKPQTLHQGGIFWVETQVLQMYEFGSVFSNSKGKESESSSKLSCEVFTHCTWKMLLHVIPQKRFPSFLPTSPKNDVYVDISWHKTWIS